MLVAPHLLSSPDDLLRMLDAAGLPHQRWGDDPVGTMVHRCGPRHDTDVYLRWQAATGQIRCRVPVVQSVSPGRDEEAALAVAAANVKLALPGFVLDVERGSIYWRAVALMDCSGSVSSDVVGTLLHLGPRTVAAFRHRLEAAARPAAGATLDTDALLFAAL